MTALPTIRRRLVALGVTTLDLRGGHDAELSALAPLGKEFHATGCHSLVVSRDAATGETLAAWSSRVASDLAGGLDPCTTPNCEMCAEMACDAGEVG